MAKDDYSAGMDELHYCARVVCPTHAKNSQEPVRHLYSVCPRLVEQWLYRVGLERSGTTCAICGICQLRLWGNNAEVCHLVSYASGGSGDADNNVVGSAPCNRQQGTEDMAAYSQRISAIPRPFPQMLPKAHLSAARKELMSCAVMKAARNAVTRVKACVERLQRRGRSRQPTLNEDRVGGGH